MKWLEIEQAVVRYGSTLAVNNISLEISQGEIVALLGASGSGKSSLLRAIAGLEPLASGTIRLHGKDLSNVPTYRRGLGMMFQDGQLFGNFNVAGNVGYGLNKLPKKQRQTKVNELLELVGLSGYGKRPITALSGGQAQRVALARYLAPEPKLLLLDEPLSALDRQLRTQLVGTLREILKSTGTTAVYVTHDQDEAFAVANRVAVLGEGNLWQVDRPDLLWRKPASKEVAEFLGYGPFISPRLAKNLGFDCPATSSLVALAPNSLITSDNGTTLAVLNWHYRIGGVSAQVVLPDNQLAIMELADPPDDSLTVKLSQAAVI